MRALRRQPALPESLFVASEYMQADEPAKQSQELLGDDGPQLLRRLRHIYQVGLLAALKGGLSPVHLRMMSRASGRMEKHAGGEYWWLLRVVLEGLSIGDISLTPARQRLLASADRQFRQLQKDPGKTPQLNADLRNELVWVASACVGVDRCEEVKSRYGLSDAAVSDSELREWRAKIFGSTESAMASLAEALKTDLHATKDQLEQYADEGGSGEISLPSLLASLSRIASVLKSAGQQRFAEPLEKRVQALANTARETHLDAELSELAEVIVRVETALESGGTGVGQSDMGGDLLGDNAAGARKLVLTELAGEMVQVQRAVSGYGEASAENAELSNAASQLYRFGGCLQILNESRAANVVRQTATVIESLTGDGVQGAAEPIQIAENLADALVCVDYHTDAMLQNEVADETIMAMAEQSLQALASQLPQEPAGA